MSVHAVSAPGARRARARAPDLQLLVAHWQRALDAADRALRAATDTLPAQYLQKHRRALAEERRQTADLLVTLTRVQGGARRHRPR